MRLLDKIYNNILYLCNTISKFKGNRTGKMRIDFNKCKLSAYDEFNTYNDTYWSKQNYIDNDYIISDQMIEFKNNGLSLYNNDNVIGEIISKKIPLNYGIYEFNVELPTQSPHINPKIKLVRSDNNKTKIYLFDYTIKDNRCVVNTGVVYNDNDIVKRQALDYSTYELDTYNVNIKLVFKKNYLNFYIDNFKVRRIRCKDILKELTETNYNIVISNNLLSPNKNIKSTFKIKNYSFYEFI